MEALILRRNYPVPVTFADLRRAAMEGELVPKFRDKKTNRTGRLAHRASWFFGPKTHANIYRQWHADLKSTTGASDDVYAVVDGREVYLGRVADDGIVDLIGDARGFRVTMVLPLMDEADRRGYWERPREVRLDLQERVPSLASIDAAVQRSLVEAEVRRGH